MKNWKEEEIGLTGWLCEQTMEMRLRERSECRQGKKCRALPYKLQRYMVDADKRTVVLGTSP
jgi:hypothetical protein